MYKIALIGNIHEDGVKLLKKYKFSLNFIRNFSKKNLINKLKNIDGIALRTSKLDKSILQECKKLKIISRHGVGVDNIDVNFTNKKKITILITGNSNSASVAEHVISMFLNLCKNSFIADKLVRSNNFRKKYEMSPSYELYQKNIFIIGFGRIGKSLSKRCNAFESNVLVYDPYVDKKTIKKNNCIPINFNQGIKKADFISIHLPLTKKTKYLITKKHLTKMKKTCIIVNTSRGSIIKEKDLYWALSKKIIHSAGLDVFETEPPLKNNPLFKLNNIIFSPHNAALTEECKRRMGVETCQNLINYFFNKKKIKKNNFLNT
ncbi:MAG: Hydroxypyruvate reductase [Alphaproteobacteria bacterium MarineAlpha5_Bin9]|nr:MAG: Hydroxypyruvate reductase [Alphaproteobacteria bacterium MarineAlpha5_Bin9]|tara:strand:+ start:2254 stop:3210 length:957 start_codon:yes stop_codon:yes gene_type:complete